MVLQKSQQVLMRFDCFPGRPEQPGGRLGADSSRTFLDFGFSWNLPSGYEVMTNRASHGTSTHAIKFGKPSISMGIKGHRKTMAKC